MDLAIIVINFVNINNTFPREKEKEEERGGEREELNKTMIKMRGVSSRSR